MSFKNLSITTQGYIFTILTMLVWGSFSLLARLNAYWNIQVWDILALRFGIGFLVLLPIIIYRKDYKYLWNWRGLMLALAGSVAYCSFVYSGFFFAPVAHGAVFLNGTIALFVAILAYFVFQQAFDKNTWVSLFIILITLGTMTFLISDDHSSFGIGDICLIGASISWAIFSILLRKWKFSAWQMIINIAFWSSVVYLPIYFICFTPQLSQVEPVHLAIQTVFHSIFVLIIATLTYAKAVEYIGAFKASGIASLAPFIAALVAVPLLNETLNPVMICGLIGMSLGALQPWRWLPVSRT